MQISERAVLLLLALAALIFFSCSTAERLVPGSPIVLIVVDTLRADRLGIYGSARPTSPELDRWASRGAVFEHAFTTSPWTLPSVASILTGLYPQAHGSGRGERPLENGMTERIFLGLDATVPNLAPLLAAEGYATAAFVTNSFLRPEFGLSRGFTTYEHARNSSLPGRGADVMVERALAWVNEQQEQPFLLLLHLLDPHMPYDPAEEVAGLFSAGYAGPLRLPFDTLQKRRIRRGRLKIGDPDREFIRATYDEQVAFVDRHLGRFLDGLAARGIIDRGLVVFTADHGEEHFDHGRFEHGHTMFQELLRIPLVVWGRGVEPRRVESPVSLVDLLPTVLNGLRLPAPTALDGVSLWPLLTGEGRPSGRVLLAQNSLYGTQRQSVIRWPYKLIVDTEEGGALLFDLDSDPAEREDLREIETASFESMLAEFRNAQSPSTHAAAVELSEEMRRELSALGYLN